MKNQYRTLSYEFSIFNPNSFISFSACLTKKRQKGISEKGFSEVLQWFPVRAKLFFALCICVSRRKSSLLQLVQIFDVLKSYERREFWFPRTCLKIFLFYGKLFVFFLICVLIDWFGNQFSFFVHKLPGAAKAIKELNQLLHCDWLTSLYEVLVHSHPPFTPCTLLYVFFMQFIQFNFFFLHLHFPALIASSSLVRKIHCWFNLHHAIMQIHTEQFLA